MRRSLLDALGAGLMLALLGGGCSSFNETHYIKSVDKHGKAVNHFRLTVSGSTCLSSSRYISGYFEERVVDEYFGTISQPNDGAFKTVVADKEAGDSKTATPAAAGAAKSAPVRSAQPVLVLLLSSNADAIAEQLGALAESKETLTAVTALANKDKLRNVQAANSSLAQQRERGESIKRLADQYIGSLEEGGEGKTLTDQSTATAKLLAFLNVLAQKLGNDQPFASLDKAAEWINAKRAALLKE